MYFIGMVCDRASQSSAFVIMKEKQKITWFSNQENKNNFPRQMYALFCAGMSNTIPLKCTEVFDFCVPKYEKFCYHALPYTF